ncbi:flowering time control protein FPA [Heracleum sosnowskyi]|uniref:Flowering time control protein FPA n=1 Tax=Heracleum sosnowskyi TaxID=360622 RepID=A0AAD8M6F1_9APIA|nr:flowering time control protein FPA [Heracleum sosnowskyi]
MSGRGGRDRTRRDYTPRSEERSHHGRSNAPPSRHLWVGNLSHNLSERTLKEHFLRFGELESLAFQPGRSYAFINYKHDEEAFAAIRALQGFFVAGNPLKIEFAKAEKSSSSSVDEEYLLRRDDQRSAVRGSPYPHKEPRAHRSSPDPSYPNKSKMDDKSLEPSEVLWIGFPALLKVDETILRKAFSPFGEIVKITAFPGRSYAFVRFRNVMSACRAKDALHGKLFGNPRVHICFARSESSGRNPLNAPSSPSARSYGRMEASENFRHDRNYENISGDLSMRSPHFISDMESRDPDIVPFQRKGNIWPVNNGAFEQGFQDLGPELGPPRSVYEHRASPPRDRGARFRDYSPQKFPRQGQLYDDAWDLPEDAMLYHESKKLKTTSFPHEHELPEYPFRDPEQVKHVLPRIPDYHHRDAFDKNFDSGSFGREQIPDRSMNLTQPYGERSEHWNMPYDSLQVGSMPLPPNQVDRKRLTPELHQSSSNEVWKWEGTIAKGGTPVCRARCFPVGKVLDMILPDFLDCTARTGLDMLAKHYYQSTTAWVVFFVPETDVDISFYNEFMNYLGEKQRAAVAKIDDNTTLFLVPPSEFSEKVLKVPGKLSISGVILRLETPGPSIESHNMHERKDTSFGSFQGDTSYPRQISPSGSYSSMAPFPNHVNPGVNNLPFHGKLPAPPLSYAGHNHTGRTLPDTINDDMHSNKQNPSLGQNWSVHNMQNPNAGARNIATQPSSSAFDSVNQGYNPATPRAAQPNFANYTTGVSGTPYPGSSNPSHDTNPPSSSSLLAAALQPEKLAQLASSLLGQQRQTAVVSAGQDFRQSSSTSQSEHMYRPQQNISVSSNQASSDYPQSQFSQQQQVQQFQQHQTSNVPAMPQRELSTVAPGNQQHQNTGTQEDGDADPQKRLQATLQLAAALLQQIQQGKQN